MPPPFLRRFVGLTLRKIVLEQYPVRYVFAAFRREILLAQECGPAEQFEDFPNEIIFSLRLVRRLPGRKLGKNVRKGFRKIADFGGRYLRQSGSRVIESVRKSLEKRLP